MKKLILTVLAAMTLLGAAGCTKTTMPITTPVTTMPVTTTPPVSTTPTKLPVSFDVAQSSESRITSPDVTSSQLAALVSGNNTFAFNLYQQLTKGNNGNMFYSPYSISTALAMTYAGANGDTATQMAKALDFTLPQAQLHPAFNDLALQLASRGQGASGTNGKSFALNIANALWCEKTYNFLPNFLNTLGQNYGAGVNLLDFINSPELSRVTINNWVSNETNDKINDLIPTGAITPQTRLVLTNAIYFDAAWQNPFSADKTQNGTFNLLDGSTVSVPMMNNEASYGYTKGSGYQAVELPYSGDQVAMDIIMPDAGNFTTFESGMTAGSISGIINNLQTKSLNLTMPKFNFDSSFSLNDALSALGMPIAFSNDADFSGMTGNKDLTIADVVHKAYVAVDEQGTEAAAATGVVMSAMAVMNQNILTIDQPFIFIIRDIQTGSILFVGRVLNPAS
ncbi:MAG: serpin family protein [Dehalococcoidales bacterium]